MKCSNCHKVLLGATLVSDSQIRCSYCNSLTNSPFTTNYGELSKTTEGVCPFCGKSNKSFKHTKGEGRFICRECGVSFFVESRVDKIFNGGQLRDYPKAVIEDAKWVDSVLLTGVTLAGTTIVAKLLGITEINVLDLKLPLQNIWVVFVVLTLAHFYAAWLLNRSIYGLWTHNSDEQCLSVYKDVTTTGWVFVRGLSPRTKIIKSLFGMKVYEMRLDDPSTWATHIIALLLIIAIIPFDISRQQYFWGMLFLSLVILISNWVIGSIWLVSLSELALPHSESIYLARKRKATKTISLDFAPTIAMSSSPAMKGSPITLISVVLTASVACLLGVGPMMIGIMYKYFSNTGQADIYVKSLLTLIILVLMPRLLKRLSSIKKYGKPLFILANIVFGMLIIFGYWNWIT